MKHGTNQLVQCWWPNLGEVIFWNLSTATFLILVERVHGQVGVRNNTRSHSALGRMFLRLDTFLIFRSDRSSSVQMFFQFAEQMNAACAVQCNFPVDARKRAAPATRVVMVASGHEQHSPFSFFQFVQSIVPNYERGPFRNLTHARATESSYHIAMYNRVPLAWQAGRRLKLDWGDYRDCRGE